MQFFMQYTVPNKYHTNPGILDRDLHPELIELRGKIDKIGEKFREFRIIASKLSEFYKWNCEIFLFFDFWVDIFCLKKS